MKDEINLSKVPSDVIISITSVIRELMETKPTDAIMAFSYYFCDHGYKEIADLLYTERSKLGPRMLTREGAEWRISKVKNRIKEYHEKEYGDQTISSN